MQEEQSNAGGKNPTDILIEMAAGLPGNPRIEDMEKIIDYGIQNKLFSEETLRVVQAKNPALGLVLRYALAHREEREKRLLESMSKTQV